MIKHFCFVLYTMHSFWKMSRVDFMQSVTFFYLIFFYLKKSYSPTVGLMIWSNLLDDSQYYSCPDDKSILYVQQQNIRLSASLFELSCQTVWFEQWSLPEQKQIWDQTIEGHNRSGTRLALQGMSVCWSESVGLPGKGVWVNNLPTACSVLPCPPPWSF